MKKTKRPQKHNKKDEEFPTYNFNYEMVKEHFRNLKDIKEKLRYLNYVMKEKKNSDGIDIDLHFPGPSFINKIKNEIRYYEKELTLTDPYKAEGYDKIVWQKNRQDFAALFDVLMQIGFITYRRDKYKMLSDHFTWNDEEMKPEQLKHLVNNVKNKSHLYRTSDEIQKITDELKAKVVKGS